uniref:Uncharacterized protein n=1 Tax=Ditylenchus dipsaci TaxID=166011 RepID=A0A915ECG5_9BILA
MYPPMPSFGPAHPPIQTSSYQPYLAYGAPPNAFQPAQKEEARDHSGFHSSPPTFTSYPTGSSSAQPLSSAGYQQAASKAQEQYYQNYQASRPPMGPNSFTPSSVPSSVGSPMLPDFSQPTGHRFPPPVSSSPISFPMPPLSSLGISNLVAPPPVPNSGYGQESGPPTQQTFQQYPPMGEQQQQQPFFG